MAGTIRERSLEALTDIDNASRALDRNDSEEARRLLSSATRTYQRIYDRLPGGALAARYEVLREQLARQAASGGQSVRVSFTPLLAALRTQEDYLDPRVVQLTNKAVAAQGNGDERNAAALLTRAEQRLTQDISLVPISHAFTYTAAAEEALEDGSLVRAKRLLIDVREAAVQVSLRAPLTPIRFDLRAAAVAAQQKDEHRAEALTRRASDNLRSLSRSVQPPNETLQELTRKTDKVEQELADGKQVKPGELLSIADGTYSLVQRRRG